MAGANADKHAPTPPPHSWTGLLLGFVLLAVGTVIGLGLVFQFVHGRRLNLLEHTHEMAQRIETLLATNQVPAESIQRAPGVRKETERLIWFYYEIDAQVPRTLSVDGLAEVLVRDLTRSEVAVTDISGDDPTERALSMAMAGAEFAVVRLRGPQRADWREAARRVAEEVSAMLRASAAFEAATAAVEAQESPAALWTQTTIAAETASIAHADRMEEALREMLAKSQVRVERIATPTEGQRVLSLSRDGTVWVVMHLEVSADGNGNGLVEQLPLESVELPEAKASPPAEQPLHPKRINGPVAAIIVDDGGYGGKTTDAILALDPALTLAILPGVTHSTDTAERAKELGFEVIIHMPMETHNRNVAFPGELKAAMTEEEIETTTQAAFDSVPQAVGLNNHTGSLFTSTADAMRAFLETVKAKELYFIDSRTLDTTVGAKLAQELGVPTASRDVFLDNVSEPDYIKGQVETLIEVAKEQGSAIGICHFRKTTAEVLKEMLPVLEKEGVTLVHASKLVQ